MSAYLFVRVVALLPLLLLLLLLLLWLLLLLSRCTSWLVRCCCVATNGCATAETRTVVRLCNGATAW